MALDLSHLGSELQNVSGIVGGVDQVVNGAPGGAAAQAEQSDFSLAQLGNLIGGLGNLLNPPKPQSAPAVGDPHKSPVTGLAELSFPPWLPLAAAGAVGLLLVFLIARR
jgi:hypothetical protein